MTDPATDPMHRALAAFEVELRAFGSEPGARLRRALSRLGRETRPVEAGMGDTCVWLDTALAARPPETADLIDALAPVTRFLAWREGPPRGIDEGYAHAEITGPEGPVPSSECRVGRYLQRPDLYYRAHAHDAEELYFILSGTADRQVGDQNFAAAPGTRACL